MERKWGPRKSKSADIGAFTKRKEDGIKKAQDRKEVSISINASVRDAAFLLTTLVSRGEFLGAKKFSIEWYFEELAKLADMFEQFTDERLSEAMKNYLETTAVDLGRKKDFHNEAKEYAGVDDAMAGAGQEML